MRKYFIQFLFDYIFIFMCQLFSYYEGELNNTYIIHVFWMNILHLHHQVVMYEYDLVFSSCF